MVCTRVKPLISLLYSFNVIGGIKYILVQFFFYYLGSSASALPSVLWISLSSTPLTKPDIHRDKNNYTIQPLWEIFFIYMKYIIQQKENSSTPHLRHFELHGVYYVQYILLDLEKGWVCGRFFFYILNRDEETNNLTLLFLYYKHGKFSSFFFFKYILCTSQPTFINIDFYGSL